MSNENALTPRREQSPAMISIAESRVAQEVQAAMVIARKFPRDEDEAFKRMNRACTRPGLAEASVYTYPRGSETVTGPSIRLAEALAQCWGNLDFGIIEVEQRGGESSVMAYCWDLQTNVRQTKVFQVAHARYSRAKGVVSLTDPRDIYEMTANQGARRLRACILGVIPGDMVESAVMRCRKTLAEESGVPLKDRIRLMVASFDEFGVSPEMIEANLGHKTATTSEAELVKLRGIFRSIRDNMASVEQFFGAKEPEPKAAEKPPEMEIGNVREGEGENPHRKPPAKTAAPKKKAKPTTSQVAEAYEDADHICTGEPPSLDMEAPVDDDLGLPPGESLMDEPAGDALRDAQEGAEPDGPDETPGEATTQEEPFLPPDEPEKPSGPPRKLTGAMLGRLHMGFRRIKCPEPTRLAFLAKIFGVDSTKGLSYENAADLLEQLESGKEDPEGALEWIRSNVE